MKKDITRKKKWKRDDGNSSFSSSNFILVLTVFFYVFSSNAFISLLSLHYIYLQNKINPQMHDGGWSHGNENGPVSWKWTEVMFFYRFRRRAQYWLLCYAEDFLLLDENRVRKRTKKYKETVEWRRNGPLKKHVKKRCSEKGEYWLELKTVKR